MQPNLLFYYDVQIGTFASALFENKFFALSFVFCVQLFTLLITEIYHFLK